MDEILRTLKGRHGDSAVFEWARGVDSWLLSIWLHVDGHETRSVVFGPDQVAGIADVIAKIALAADPDRLERAALAVAGVWRTSQHGQLCPVWTRRNKGVQLGECDCWILSNARAYAALALAVDEPAVSHG